MEAEKKLLELARTKPRKKTYRGTRLVPCIQLGEDRDVPPAKIGASTLLLRWQCFTDCCSAGPGKPITDGKFPEDVVSSYLEASWPDPQMTEGMVL